MIFHSLKHASVSGKANEDLHQTTRISSPTGQYTIEQIQPQPDGTPSKIKVKVRLNRNGIFDVTQASLIETIEEANAPVGSGKCQTHLVPSCLHASIVF